MIGTASDAVPSSRTARYREHLVPQGAGLESLLIGGLMASKVTGQRSPRWAFMARMEIPSKRNDGEIYLSRLRIIQTPFFGVYVHNVNEPDFDRDPHDHPWNFLSVILKGGYLERVWARPADPACRSISYQRRWNRWTVHKMTMDMAHQIERVDPGTVSLIFVGPRRRNWGFWTNDGWYSWQEYEEMFS